MFIALYDAKTNVVRFPYAWDDGDRTERTEIELGPGLTTDHPDAPPVRVGSDVEATELGAIQIGGSETESFLGVPITSGDRVIGVIAMEQAEVDAFSETDERLLSTLAASMGVALENARLFDETKRLLRETDERAAELAVVNSVQQGLAERLDIQSMYDLVGDKITEIFDVHGVDIERWEAAEGGSRRVHRRARRASAGRADRAFRVPQVGRREPGSAPQSRPARPRRGVRAAADRRRRAGEVRPLRPDDHGRIGEGHPSDREPRARGRVQRVGPSPADHARRRPRCRAGECPAVRPDEEAPLETNERAAELALINDVQRALSENLDIQAMYDLVGDKIQEIFDAQVVDIGMYDIRASFGTGTRSSAASASRMTRPRSWASARWSLRRDSRSW